MENVIDLTSESDLIQFRSSIKKSIKTLYKLKCAYCGETIIVNGRLLYLRLNTQYMAETQVCGNRNSTCYKRKQAEINKLRAMEGNTAAKGHKVSEEQKIKYIKSMTKNKRYEQMVEKRQGKTYEVMYGEEKAKEYKEKVRQARLKQADPRLGKKHSISSKLLMSIKSQENMERGKNPSKRYLHGKYYRWYDEIPQYFMSSLEYAYFCILNIHKVYWEKNYSKIRLPYLKDDGSLHFYSPDIIIYKDRSLQEIDSIIELKPFCYTVLGKYANLEVNKKNELLMEFCKNNNTKGLLLTEHEINKELYDLGLASISYKGYGYLARKTREYLNGERDLYKEYQESTVNKT